MRDTRELFRELHHEAVQRYKESHGDCKPEEINRNTIKRIKKEIVKYQAKFEALKDKFNK